jgi:hypothetical protein
VLYCIQYCYFSGLHSLLNSKMKTRRFGSWFCTHPHVKIPTLLGLAVPRPGIGISPCHRTQQCGRVLLPEDVRKFSFASRVSASIDKLFIKMTAFWDIALCSLVGANRRFRGAYFLHHQGYHHRNDGGSTHL